MQVYNLPHKAQIYQNVFFLLWLRTRKKQKTIEQNLTSCVVHWKIHVINWLVLEITVKLQELLKIFITVLIFIVLKLLSFKIPWFQYSLKENEITINWYSWSPPHYFLMVFQALICIQSSLFWDNYTKIWFKKISGKNFSFLLG